MLVRVIKAFKDVEFKRILREKGTLMKVSPARGEDLIKKGLALPAEVINAVKQEPKKPKAEPKADK